MIVPYPKLIFGPINLDPDQTVLDGSVSINYTLFSASIYVMILSKIVLEGNAYLSDFKI